MTDWEEQIAELSNALIVGVEAGDRDRVQAVLGRLSTNELQAVAASCAAGLVRQEQVNETLAQSIANMAAKNRTLETANVSLFAERRKLTEKVGQLKQIQADQAARMGRLREKVSA